MGGHRMLLTRPRHTPPCAAAGSDALPPSLASHTHLHPPPLPPPPKSRHLGALKSARPRCGASTPPCAPPSYPSSASPPLSAACPRI